MRNYLKKILLIAIPVFVIVACDRQKLKELEAQNLKLSMEASIMDSTINEYLFTMESIEDNLNKIKEKENLIQLRTSGDLDSEGLSQVLDDLAMISDYMDENKQRMHQLNQKLDISSNQVRKLKNMVDRLTQQMVERDHSIASLKVKIEKLDIDNALLQNDVEKLTVQNDTLGGTNLELSVLVNSQTELLEKQNLELNTAYFAFGSGKDLLGKDIIRKDGGILGIGSVEKLCAKLDINDFSKIDIATTTTIPLMAKKIKLVTNHPVDSYKIESDANLYTSLVITNPERFWNVSKFLVVRVN